MTSIEISIVGAHATAKKSGKLTCGMVGIPVSFTIDKSWDGLNIIPVFRCGDITKDNGLINNQTTIPHEVLQYAGKDLYIGAEGRSADGKLVIPTVWARVGRVHSGAQATGEIGLEPTPSQFDRFMKEIGNVDDKLNKAVEDIIATGALKGEKGEAGISATHLWNGTTLTITSASGTSSADLKGAKGENGNNYVLTETDKTEIAEQAAALISCGQAECITNGVGEPFFSYTATFATDTDVRLGILVPDVSVTAKLDTVYWLEVNGELYKCHWERNIINSDLYDESGNVWVTTTLNGVYVSAPMVGTYTFKLYAPSEEQMLDPQYLPPNVAKKKDISQTGSSIDVTAEVGQTIVVEAVDENGKPTKWKAADYQSRTHWSEDGLEQVSVYPKYVSSLASEYGFYRFSLTLSAHIDNFPLTSIHSIKYDGVEYSNLATAQVGEYIFFGNLYFLNQLYGTSFENTGEPFLAVSDVYGVGIFTLDSERTTHACELYINGTYHHRLDACYAPKIPVIDLTKYYTAIPDVDYGSYSLHLTGDDYYEKVYKVLKYNDIVKFVYHSAYGIIQTICGFPHHTQSVNNIFVRCDSDHGHLKVHAMSSECVIDVSG